MEYSATALQQVRERRLLIDQVDLWLYEEIAPFLGQRILEIGCGLGNFACHLTNKELYVGIEISNETVSKFNELYASCHHMRAYVADVTDETFLEYSKFGFDTVFSLNVLEHVQDDFAALRNVKRVLRPGGVLILVLPAHQWLYGSMDRSIGHFRRYGKESLADALGRAGFACVSQKYLNGLGAVGWFVNGRILKNNIPPSGQLRTFNRLVPLLRRIEGAVKMPFGISLLTIAKVV